ncbi:MAG: DUF2062 domain-containing protein [Sandaracinaceae bacterium]|nr:DUF2062 domain-containing protein [Sandaracinaceae bacterium]
MTWWHRLKRVVVDKILGLHDTPHRIAWGVFLGFVVAFTPTIGFQMMIFVAVAALLRANKVSGLPIVWVTNPFTAVPLYLLCWRVGAFVLGTDADAERGQRIIERLMGAETGWEWGRLFEGDFWREVGATFWALGAELWLGGFVVGAALGAMAYPLTLWGVRAYRRARAD